MKSMRLSSSTIFVEPNEANGSLTLVHLGECMDSRILNVFNNDSHGKGKVNVTI